jgi:hypothetical protein
MLLIEATSDRSITAKPFNTSSSTATVQCIVSQLWHFTCIITETILETTRWLNSHNLHWRSRETQYSNDNSMFWPININKHTRLGIQTILCEVCQNMRPEFTSMLDLVFESLDQQRTICTSASSTDESMLHVGKCCKTMLLIIWKTIWCSG